MLAAPCAVEFAAGGRGRADVAVSTTWPAPASADRFSGVLHVPFEACAELRERPNRLARCGSVEHSRDLLAGELSNHLGDCLAGLLDQRRVVEEVARQKEAEELRERERAEQQPAQAHGRAS